MTLERRRKDVARQIAEDPWDVVHYHTDPGTRVESSAELVGRIAPTGAPWGSRVTSPTRLAGERLTAHQSWLLLTKYDAGTFAVGDRIVATHRETSLKWTFAVVFASAYPYKQEIVLDEQH